MPEPRKWADFALCAQTDPNLFVLEHGASAKYAREICAACPVAAACLEWAQQNELNEGIYAGLTANQRRKLRTTAGAQT